MANNYVFPTSLELMSIAQDKLPTLTQDDPIFGLFPIRTKNVVNIKWEQKDTYKGLQQLRGVGGTGNRVARPNAKSYMFEPGVYGEFITIDEQELLTRRPLGQWDGFVDISDLVADAQDQLLNRRVDRIRWICWQLVVNGFFSVPLPSGGQGHGDAYATVTGIGQYGMQTAVAASAWSTFATSTPLQDLRGIALLSRGRSIDLGSGATAFMNRTTFNNLIRNTNAGDLGGKKALNNFGSITTPGQVNSIFLDADVPQIQIYDNGYIDETNTFQLFIPNGTVIIVGKRTNGDPLGEYIMTRNAQNPGFQGGPYTRVIDRGAGPQPEIPSSVEVHDGHSGGPTLWYPSAVVRLTGV